MQPAQRAGLKSQNADRCFSSNGSQALYLQKQIDQKTGPSHYSVSDLVVQIQGHNGRRWKCVGRTVVWYGFVG